VADAFYLNCDAEAFRLIHMLLCGTASMQSLEHLSDLSQSIVRATSEYLLCFEVVRAIDDVVAKKMDHQTVLLHEAKQRESELHHQLRLKSEEMDELRSKTSFRAIMENLISSQVTIRSFYCGSYRTHRPRNICGEKVVIVGDCGSPICDTCDETMKLVKSRGPEVIQDIADLEGLFSSF